MKKTLSILSVIVIVGFGVYFLTQPSPTSDVSKVSDDTGTAKSANDAGATTAPVDKTLTVIGKSSEGRDITAYHYGTGEKEILLVGGIHGGYEWNTSLVAYEAMDYFIANPTFIPAGVKVTVIPVLNPDGLFKVVGKAGRFTQSDVSPSKDTQILGRYNANSIDLNRNFDCNWQSSAKWQNKTVSGGNSVFSEPESQAIKIYAEENKPLAVVVWYSAAGGVYSSSCDNAISSETKTITKKYADASGYPAYESFDVYETTGDMPNWFAKNSVPAISVLLTNHTDTEWAKNQKGIDALLKYYVK